MFFTAIALNYAKAFKVKNKVVEYLQDNEIGTIAKMNAADYKKMTDYFENKILKDCNYGQSKAEMSCGSDAVYCDNGIEIYEIDARIQESNRLGVYYRVNTYFPWSGRFLKTLTALSSRSPNGEIAEGIWKISGETRAIASE